MYIYGERYNGELCDVKKFKDLELEALVPMFELKHENPALSSDELLSLAQ
jgi:hypothetical protein